MNQLPNKEILRPDEAARELSTKRCTPAEVAQRFKMSRSTIYRYIDLGWLKSKKIGPRRMLIAEEDIEQFIEKWNNEG